MRLMVLPRLMNRSGAPRISVFGSEKVKKNVALLRTSKFSRKMREIAGVIREKDRERRDAR